MTFLPPLTVASCHVVGNEPPGPELRGWARLLAWAEREGFITGQNEHRFFGFNNPEEVEPGGEHGYECWMTVPQGTVGDEQVVIKRFEGGTFAVIATPLSDIERAWGRFLQSLKENGLEYAGGQYLEEHLLTDAQILAGIQRNPDLFVAQVQMRLHLPVRPTMEP